MYLTETSAKRRQKIKRDETSYMIYCYLILYPSMNVGINYLITLKVEIIIKKLHFYLGKHFQHDMKYYVFKYNDRNKDMSS